MISVRGNWPLVPTMDVVVPHARTMADLLEVLDVIVADDHTSRGDFWRVQPWIELPAASTMRPDSYPALASTAADAPGVLAGRRIGVPKMYSMPTLTPAPVMRRVSAGRPGRRSPLATA